ncbi:hypothetical protein Cni_G14107 [Canna indica]|uniref:Transposase MuDR plant domain-containing protein n=1 Tax=Canna indica TaxID=4628 RepID=A0AAQ3KB39_9LILI|nr:hypothetical protein Cni_G14107 [Canna indica]
MGKRKAKAVTLVKKLGYVDMGKTNSNSHSSSSNDMERYQFVQMQKAKQKEKAKADSNSGSSCSSDTPDVQQAFQQGKSLQFSEVLQPTSPQGEQTVIEPLEQATSLEGGQPTIEPIGQSDDDNTTSSYDANLPIGEADDELMSSEFEDFTDDEYIEARTIKIEDILRGSIPPSQRVDDNESLHSEYDASDDEVLTPNSETEVEAYSRRKNQRRKIYNPKCKMEDIRFEIGMKFESIKKFKQVVQSYALSNGVNIRWVRCCKEIMEAKCMGSCPWRIYGSWKQHEATFIIKSYEKIHKCSRSMSNRQTTVEWLSNYCLENFRSNPSWDVKLMSQDFQSKFFITLPKAKWYRVRSAALEKLRGSVEDHYTLLGPYVSELKRKNPTSLFQIVCDRSIPVHPLYLKEYILGLMHLKMVFSKGLEHALLERVPFVKHRSCARHLYTNWKKKFNGHYYKSLFWKAVRSMEESELNRVLEAMAADSPQAHQAFISIGLKKFCQAYVCTNYKSDNVTNNISETFNGYILNARSKPIIDMLEEIRRSLMQRMYMKRVMIVKWTDDICPNIRKKLEINKEESRFCIVTPSRNLKFEVQYMSKIRVVNIGSHSCSCRRWDLTCIPYNHAVSCITWMKDDLDKYVSDNFKRNAYLKTYANFIEPLTGKDTWPNVDGPHCLPKKMPGRPKKVRRREMNEDDNQASRYSRHGTSITCQLCFKEEVEVEAEPPHQAVIEAKNPHQAEAEVEPPHQPKEDQEGEHPTLQEMTQVAVEWQ